MHACTIYGYESAWGFAKGSSLPYFLVCLSMLFFFGRGVFVCVGWMWGVFGGECVILIGMWFHMSEGDIQGQ